MALVAVLFVSAVVTGAMCYVYLKTSRAVRVTQYQMAQINRNKQVLQALAIDLNEYSRRNPAIIPLLEQASLRIRTSTNAPAGGRP